MERVKTGIAGFDELMEGGIPKNHLVLVSGQAGAGKTIFGLQYLVTGAKLGEKGVMISLEQSKNDIFNQASDFGWDFKKLEEDGLVRILSFKPSKTHLVTIMEDIEKAVAELQPKRLVWDSVSTYGVFAETFAYLELGLSLGGRDQTMPITPESAMRKAIFDLIEKFKSSGSTTLLISELPETSDFLSRDTISEFLADGVIVLYYTAIGGETFGNIQIRKMRHTKHAHGIFETKIGPNGIEIGERSELMK